MKFLPNRSSKKFCNKMERYNLFKSMNCFAHNRKQRKEEGDDMEFLCSAAGPELRGVKGLEIDTCVLIMQQNFRP
jgi:hypothetical protein